MSQGARCLHERMRAAGRYLGFMATSWCATGQARCLTAVKVQRTRRTCQAVMQTARQADAALWAYGAAVPGVELRTVNKGRSL